MKNYTLPPLPYAYDALEPHISKQIMTLHHDKHHQGYVNGANAAMEKLEKARKGEIQIDIKAILRDFGFNADGHILHSLFWPNMAPAGKGGGTPGGKLADQIKKDFGGFDKFKAQFSDASKTVEGSGWAMLIYEPVSEQLIISQVEKHNLNHIAQSTVIIASDLWEHSWYLDYLNDKAKYVDAWWNVVNWSEADSRLGKVSK
ncbi:MAG: superoxide dismutase [Nitrososphaerota archaeon]|nr:superoxide dismutase [Nitrososphaerota archaeon]MDG7024449.1 superoxide dismutase [Nitrososphaerota archaeon]